MGTHHETSNSQEEVFAQIGKCWVPPPKKAWNLEHSFFIVSHMIFTDVPICLIFYSSDMSKVRSLRSILSHSAKDLWGQVCIGHFCSQLHPHLNMPRRACLWRHTTCLVIDQIADMFGPLGSNLGWATLLLLTSWRRLSPPIGGIGFGSSLVDESQRARSLSLPGSCSTRNMMTDIKQHQDFSANIGPTVFAHIISHGSENQWWTQVHRINAKKSGSSLRKNMHFWDSNWHATAARWRITMRSGSQCTTTELASWVCFLLILYFPNGTSTPGNLLKGNLHRLIHGVQCQQSKAYMWTGAITKPMILIAWHCQTTQSSKTWLR